MRRFTDLLSRFVARSTRHVHSRGSRAGGRSSRLTRYTRRHFLESLEDRNLLSTFTVINTGDNGGINPAPLAGTGTLRQAIIDANANPDHDTIVFNIPGDPYEIHTIEPLTNLPATSDVTIDGTTQPWFTSGGARLIELSGAQVPGGTANPEINPSRGLVLGGNATVKGLAINRFLMDIKGEGSGNNRIEANYIGLTASGDSLPVVPQFDVFGTLYGSVYGVLLNSNNNIVGGVTPESRNVIAGTYEGIRITGSGSGNRLIGNYIGTDKDGLTPLQVSIGVRLYQQGVSGNQVGEPGAGNVIVAVHDGVFIENAGNSVVQGNTVGFTVDGEWVGTGHGFVMLHAQSTGNLIGGSAPGAGNVFGGSCEITGGPHHNTVQGNYIGLNSAGTEAAPGSLLVWDSDYNTIGTDGDGETDATEGNVIKGINFILSDDNVVAGNLVGTDATGMAGLMSGFTEDGITIGVGSDRNRIGTDGNGVSDALERNIVSGGWSRGIHVNNGGQTADYNIIAGNYVGTNKNGTAALPNRFGVTLGGVNNRLGTNADGVNDDAERNVISGNLWSGVGAGPGNAVAGNYIGTDVTGLTALGNGLGVSIGGSVLGGTTPAARNVISGNLGTGVEGYNNAVIQGNYIGVDKNGSPLGNGADGVLVHFVQSNVTIGGATPGAGNVIAHNDRNGVTVSHTLQHAVPIQPSTSIAIRGNSIHSNDALGIDLAEVRWLGFGNPAEYQYNELVFGVTGNDLQDVDGGNNLLQNFPVLTTAYSGASARVLGTLNSTPGNVFTVDFYANTAADSSSNGEGQRYLGSTTATTDGAGNASFTATGLAAASTGEFVTATATDASGNTSEFSVARIAERPEQIVTVDIQPESLNVDSNGTLTVVIFGAADFNAAAIDIATVRFAGAAVWQSTLVDANNDGRLDMQLKFRTEDTNLDDIYAQLLLDDEDADGVLDSTRQVAEVAVTGETLDDHLFAGTDSVTLFLAGKKLRELLDQLFG